VARPKVVVAGAGFGGLWAARELAGRDVDVLVVDRNNYHTFFPLLYQVGAAELVPTDIAFPIRAIFRDAPNVDVCLAEITSIDLGGRTVHTTRGEHRYDALVVALGSEPNFFDTPGAEEHAFPMRWMDHAMELRHHILARFEAASFETDPERRRGLLTFAVVGGGYTGVEFSGALAELIHGPLLRDFPDIAPDEVRVVLLEGLDRVLPGMEEELGRYAADRLESRHVEISLGVFVEEVRPDRVVLSDGSTVLTDTVVWTAGVRGSSTLEAWGFPAGKTGRVRVTRELHLEDHPEVFVVGDLSQVEGRDGEVLPQVAPVAMQQGERAAGNLLARLDRRPLVPFEYDDPGMLAVIGRNAAVARVFGRTFKGFFAWVLWAFVHVFKLVGFRNRALVLVNWSWNYISYRRAVRLILAGVGSRQGPEADEPATHASHSGDPP
jgi:NADH dehydrogenase